MIGSYEDRGIGRDYQALSGSLGARGPGKSGFYLRDNKPGSVVQRKQVKAMADWGILPVQRKAEETGLPVQMVW